MERYCEICGSVIVNRPKSKICLPCYQKSNREKTKERYQAKKNNPFFKCPCCGRMHSFPKDLRGSKYQYCPSCREYVSEVSYWFGESRY